MNGNCLSSIKRLENILTDSIKETDRTIASERFYILSVSVDYNTQELSKRILDENILQLQIKPFCIYTRENKIMMMFSNQKDDKKHEFDGSHHLIVSNTVSLLTLKTGKVCSCIIIEIETRSSIIGYLTFHIYNGCMNYLHGKIGKSTKTLREIQNENKEMFDKLTSHEKFGTIYKINKNEIITFSGLIDYNSLKSVYDFVFGTL